MIFSFLMVIVSETVKKGETIYFEDKLIKELHSNYNINTLTNGIKYENKNITVETTLILNCDKVHISQDNKKDLYKMNTPISFENHENLIVKKDKIIFLMKSTHDNTTQGLNINKDQNYVIEMTNVEIDVELRNKVTIYKEIKSFDTCKVQNVPIDINLFKNIFIADTPIYFLNERFRDLLDKNISFLVIENVDLQQKYSELKLTDDILLSKIKDPSSDDGTTGMSEGTKFILFTFIFFFGMSAFVALIFYIKIKWNNRYGVNKEREEEANQM